MVFAMLHAKHKCMKDEQLVEQDVMCVCMCACVCRSVCACMRANYEAKFATVAAMQIDKARRDLGYAPQQFDLKEIGQWYKENGHGPNTGVDMGLQIVRILGLLMINITLVLMIINDFVYPLIDNDIVIP